MKTAIAWHYRTAISFAPKRGFASCDSKKCLPKGRPRAFHLLFKLSRIEEVLEAPRAGGPVRETLLPLTLPHEGGRGDRERGAFCLDYFCFFSPLNKHVKTRVLTCIDIRLMYLALKTWFKRQEYSKLSSF